MIRSRPFVAALVLAAATLGTAMPVATAHAQGAALPVISTRTHTVDVDGVRTAWREVGALNILRAMARGGAEFGEHAWVLR